MPHSFNKQVDSVYKNTDVSPHLNFSKVPSDMKPIKRPPIIYDHCFDRPDSRKSSKLITVKDIIMDKKNFYLS